MRILVGWDNPAEAELLSLYLGIGDNEVTVATTPHAILERGRDLGWDVTLLSLSLPDSQGAYEVFQELRKAQPECPIVGACHPVEVFRIARFMTHGMRSYINRDTSGDFMFLVHATLEGVVEAVRAEREQKLAERLREEIESVRKLQESIIPRDLHCPPGYRVVARYEPSQIQVVGGRPVILAGGDYYDLFRLDDDNVVILVGDASGHGMKACMSIFAMHTLVGMIRGRQYANTAAFVGEINRRLCEHTILKDQGGFITLLYGVLNTTEGTFQWTSAGHPFPLLHTLGDDAITAIGTKGATGLPLGLYDDGDYETYVTPIPRHSRLLLYTDGLIEAFHGEDEHREYGMEGVEGTLRRTCSTSLDKALQALFDDSFAFTGGLGRHDDTSGVLLERAE